MKLRLPPVIIIIIAGLFCAAALAQDYSFEVPELEFHVTPNPDASVKLEYKITFLCNDGAKPIDIVDIGMPHSNYDIGNMTAYLDGEQLPTIRRSEVVTPGVEVPLSPEIGPGQTGLFEMTFTMPDLVYQDTTDADLASLQITPTWFDGDYMTGTTDLGIIIYFPDSVQLEEILHQGDNFTQKLDLDNKKAVAWVKKGIYLTGAHQVGVSFPKRIQDRVVRMTKWLLLYKWWVDNPEMRGFLGLVFLVLFGIFYYRFTGGTGTCLFIFMLAGLIFVWVASPIFQLLFLPVFIPVWILAERSLKRKKGKYFPAIESVPGADIKRGLAVPEAAVVLEQPLGRVLTMAVFGMLKKKLVGIINREPLEVAIESGYEIEKYSDRRNLARDRGTTIRAYEQRILDAIVERPDVPIEKLDLSEAMKFLVSNTAKRMEGFDLELTREYYLSIVNKAWQEAKEIGELEERTEFVDDNLLWLMLAANSTDEFHGWHNRGYHYQPTWGHGGATTGAPAPSAPAVGGRTTVGDVAASFAGWSQNVSGNLANTLDPVGLGIMKGGGINLSGVDKVSMDMLSSMAESSGGGGGGGGGCACAGCACACACAGGGR